MHQRSLVGAAACLVVALLAIPQPADAQLGKALKRAAERAVERETSNQIDRLLSEAVRCAFDDPRCAEAAEREGKPVVYTDGQGNVITDDEGAPITDREKAAAKAPPPPEPGEGVWANYDFQPGDEILFFEDYTNDNVGDFPRRYEFVKGNWDIVEMRGERFLRNTGPRHSAFQIVLPRELPERFTIEFDAHFTSGHPDLGVATLDPENNRVHYVDGNWIKVDDSKMGLAKSGSGEFPEAMNKADEITEEVVPIRVMADGSYVKVYVGERRVANVPNAVLARTNTLHFENLYYADAEEHQMFIGPIRVAAGGADLYDRLAADGRVATRGILFATNSDRIRPESTPTLEEIGTMLQEHGDLRLRIEGHTDSEGDDSYNQELSERRAAAVKRFLVEKHGIDGARLETAGLGESQPVAENDTPEGKQKNRRVELVRLDGTG